MFLIFASILILSPLFSASLKLVKTIGNDDDDNYIFMVVGSGVISRDRSIFVSDNKGNFIAKYDWSGKFIKKIGKRGQGPGCFILPQYLDIIDDKLVFLDSSNYRTAETDLDLNNLKYHKLPSSDIYFNDFHFIGRQKFVGTHMATRKEQEYHFLKVTDLENLSENTFFSNTPIPVNWDQFRFSRYPYLMPVIGINRANGQILVSFKKPDTVIRFFLYTFDGKCLDTFSYTLDKDYEFPDFVRKSKRTPDDFTQITVYEIFFHKSLYIAHVGKARIKNRRPVEDELEKHFLIFDPKTKTLKHKLPLPPKMSFFSISEDGYLVGTDYYEETPKVYIYKLDF